jgi:aerobic-type carbon monoxide dehydrogenase small subunit (CoxS/CutS family)
VETIALTVNGKPANGTVEARLSLADFLRHHLRLTGTHVGCNHGVCGACTVIVDGRLARSCLMFAVQADGTRITTVEGLARGNSLSPLQEEFHRHHALQCGFCTPGMLITATVLLSEHPDPDETLIRATLTGNLCRCTGYVNIVRAVKAAAARANVAGKSIESGQ